MPDKRTIAKARKDKRAGKSPSTQAGEFVHDEIRKIRRGEHGARSAKQAIAIGLSEARRAASSAGKRQGHSAHAPQRRIRLRGGPGKAQSAPPAARRAVTKALKREPRSTASHAALARQATRAAKRRTAAQRSAEARKAARTKGPAVRSAAGRKATGKRD